jgi:hypothetical protein
MFSRLKTECFESCGVYLVFGVALPKLLCAAPKARSQWFGHLSDVARHGRLNVGVPHNLSISFKPAGMTRFDQRTPKARRRL